MRVLFLVVLVASAGLPAVYAAEASGLRSSDLSLGFSLNRFQDDFAFGLVLTSPYYYNDRLAVRLSGNMGFVEGIKPDDTESSWMPFTTVKLGLIGQGGRIAQAIRLYGEGGAILLMPDSDLSDDDVVGGYGVFGFEFFMSADPSCPSSYFIELGGIGVDAKAENLPGSPTYVTGFSTSVGFRYHF